MPIFSLRRNFEAAEDTRKPKGTIEYEVVKRNDNQKIFEFSEEITGIEGASAAQTIVEKVLPLQSLEPGEYTLRMKVTDEIRGETLTPEATFTVL